MYAGAKRAAHERAVQLITRGQTSVARSALLGVGVSRVADLTEEQAVEFLRITQETA